MNDEKIVIRKVNENDGYDWMKLVNSVWRASYKHIFPEEVFQEKDNNIDKKVATFTERIRNDNQNIAYVAEAKGRIIGIMCGSINSGYEHFRNEYADLNAIYIDSNYQGKGIGSSFKNIFEKWAKENGATKYVIGVLKDNSKARKVYESWGGKLSDYSSDFIKFNIGYTEIFYLYDLEKERK